MSRISENTIEMIRNNADIVSVVSSFIPLSKKGVNYWGVCPFHNDSSPSMSVNNEKKIFKCFSCNVSGNVFDFVSKYKNVDFINALKIVAEIANIKIEELENFKPVEKYSQSEKRIFEINEHAMIFYKAILSTELGLEAKEYLKSREIDKATSETFNIGFASSKISLVDNLIKKGFTEKELVDSGLVYINKSELKEYFINRLIFPIKNIDDKIIGFSARTLKDAKPKYINSKENEIFKKSELLYNCEKIININEVIVLEGFMDVIALNKIGVNNAVAIMGTALSQFHINLFNKNKWKIKLFLDGDDPGVEATIKASKLLLKNGFEFNVIENNTDSDPDELIKNKGPEFMLKMLNTFQHPINFIVEKKWNKVDTNNPENIKQFVKDMKEISFLVKDDTYKQFVKNKTNEKLSNINKEILIQKNDVFINSSKNDQKIVEAYKKAEWSIFISLLKSDEFIETISKNVDLIDNSTLRSAVRGIIEEYKIGNYRGGNTEQILKLIDDRIIHDKDLINIIISSEISKVKIGQKTIDDAFYKLNEYDVTKQIKELQIKIKEIENVEEEKNILKRIEILRNSIKRGKHG
ncbi:DNA primase [Mesoplasma photuris]|uniref:DNA primase n=1 Tax=Mesoplasma photuris TaxID=217731 RepID=UPI0004E284F6|nr:DNA primase [Mesoplasma photuris]